MDNINFPHPTALWSCYFLFLGGLGLFDRPFETLGSAKRFAQDYLKNIPSAKLAVLVSGADDLVIVSRQ